MVNQEHIVDSCAIFGKVALCLFIRLYQYTRIIRPSCCRFYPSCSDYCLQAIEVHGLIRGIVLTVKRLLKCHPFHPGGVDYVDGNGLSKPRPFTSNGRRQAPPLLGGAQ